MDGMTIFFCMFFGGGLLICFLGMYFSQKREEQRKVMEAALNRPKQSNKERNSDIAATVASAAVAHAASQDRSKLAMAKVRCAGCGAPIEQGMKFCSHCGMQIPDDTFRAQIQIDDTADIERVKYEAMESQLRQKQMKRDIARRKALWWIAGISFGIAVVVFLIAALAYNGRPGTGFLALISFSALALAIFAAYKNLFSK